MLSFLAALRGFFGLGKSCLQQKERKEEGKMVRITQSTRRRHLSRWHWFCWTLLKINPLPRNSRGENNVVFDFCCHFWFRIQKLHKHTPMLATILPRHVSHQSALGKKIRSLPDARHSNPVAHLRPEGAWMMRLAKRLVSLAQTAQAK